MAKAPTNDVAAALAALNTKVAVFSVVGSGVIAIGAAAIAGGLWVAYDLSARMSELNRAIGIVEGSKSKSVNESLEEIKAAIRDLRSPSDDKSDKGQTP